MTKPVTIPNTFATATTAIPLSQLDSDFSTVATALNDANTYSNYAADTGVANAYVVTLTGVSTTYSAGLRIQFKAGNANTGASTLNVNGGGTKNITFQDASALSSGTIAANAIVDVMYDGTQFLLMNDPAGTVGTGDVVGPAGATANAAAIFDSTTGKLIKDSKVIITPVANSSTLTIANNKTVTVNNTLTLSGTDSTTMTFPSTSATIARTDSAQTFTGVQTLSSNPILSGGTASGVLYLNGSNVATSGSALVFDGTNFGVGTSSPNTWSTGDSRISTIQGTNDTAVNIVNGSGNVGLLAFGSSTVKRAAVLTDSSANLAFYTNATNSGTSLTERMRLDSSGNLGLGVTPSAWGSGIKALQIGTGASLINAGASGDAYLGQNIYYNGTNNIYITTNAASQYALTSGVHKWLTAPSGTANTTTITNGVNYTIITSGNQTSFGAANNNVGTVFTATSSGTLSSGTVSQNITFTQAMTLDASGRLLLGTTVADTISTAGMTIGGAASGTDNTQPYNNSFFAIKNTDRTTNNLTVMYFDGLNSGGIVRGLGAIGMKTTSWTDGAINSDMIFWTSGSGTVTERARITSGGDLLVGTTDNSYTSGAGLKMGYDGTDGWMGITGGSSSNSNVVYRLYSTGAAAYRFYVGYGGTIYATSTSISALSDKTLKENIRDLETGLPEVMALKPRRFDWKNGDAQNVAGFVAQEVEQILPELVTDYVYNKDVDGNDIIKKSLKMGDILPTLVKAIQEQQALITSLTARVAALEGTQP